MKYKNKFRYKTEKGYIYPLGATPDKGGVNFSIVSQNADKIELLLFKKYDDLEPIEIINLDAKLNKTSYFWHIYVKGLKAGSYYAYRIDGPADLENEGHRFNKEKILIDPFAKGISNTLWKRKDACGQENNLHSAMRGIVIDTLGYKWDNDHPLNRPMSETIIYEMHVCGFSKSPSSKSKNPGTFFGIIEKIPYLKNLGITAVELMPVFYFDNKEIFRITANGNAVKDYWGYNTIGYFAPESSYCVNIKKGSHIKEFRDMVKALHKAEIEIILDVTFNHTNEGGDGGPVINFKGIDNSIYYHLKPENKSHYINYSGCGNSFNCNHPIAADFIVRCLEFWVKEMHIDGFRFDQGSILTRGEDGKPMKNPLVLSLIENSKALAKTKLIAEAWDATGLYQVGDFPGHRWAEWNDHYRDDIRRFVNGKSGMVGKVASRIAGSSDIYQRNGKIPTNSINFITCHDGFTLNDLVSYNLKHNENNGDNNKDGFDNNFSWNYGVEGETEDSNIIKLRKKQIKNFFALLMLSQGIPMILSGDEMGRTQKGNNNAYCQDNEISWIDWTLLDKNKDLFHFFKLMIEFRGKSPSLRRSAFFAGKKNNRGLLDISWYGCKLLTPEWENPDCRILSLTIGGDINERDIHIILNMDVKKLDFEIPLLEDRKWYRIIDTSYESPDDILEWGKELRFFEKSYKASGQSIVVLISK